MRTLWTSAAIDCCSPYVRTTNKSDVREGVDSGDDVCMSLLTKTWLPFDVILTSIDSIIKYSFKGNTNNGFEMVSKSNLLKHILLLAEKPLF